MMSNTFTSVEDYIEFIGGYRSANGNRLGMFERVPSPLSLARYDIAVIESLASQTADLSNPYTDKQAALAVRIVDKYRRQLFNLKPSIILPEDVSKLMFRLGIRKIDRTKAAYIEHDKFVIRFPYETKLIDAVKAQSREGQGSAQFDADKKVWRLSMTEYMLNWVMTVCPTNGFEVSTEIKALYDKMLAVEQTPYEIKLDIVDGQVVITNAPTSLLEYIDDNLGGVNIDNLLVLVDNSEVLGYTVSQDIKDAVKLECGDFWRFVETRRVQFKADDYGDTLDRVVEYGIKFNRLPVYVYNNGLPKKNTEHVVYLSRSIGPEVAPKLLVTTTSIMIGTKKQSWMTNAQKIIFIE
jgi:hypothetical protein